MTKKVAKVSMTYELLAELLNLPEDYRIVGISDDFLRDIVDIKLIYLGDEEKLETGEGQEYPSLPLDLSEEEE